MPAYQRHFWLQDTTTFSSYIKSMSSRDVHLAIPDRLEVEAPKILIVIINNNSMEINSLQRMFAFFGIHFVFNLEYPKKLRHCFMFLEENYGLQKRCKETVSSD